MYTYKEIITLDDLQHLTLSRALPLQKGQKVEVLIIAEGETKSLVQESPASLLQLLLDSPEMSETEY
ncbi:MAG: hypothetical protein HC877_06425 [Thioploca sp.]|nr:hypothetical protein [Thioploca sp.]